MLWWVDIFYLFGQAFTIIANPLSQVRNSSTSMEIPKEHKFKVSGIAAQTLGVFSHTAVDPVKCQKYSICYIQQL